MTGASVDSVRDSLEKAIGFQYEILRLLGRGGMGAVYHAHERALDRPVAIKVLPPEVAGTSAGRERFLREARTAARLTHPNIVPLFTFGETAGLVYYVMGYVEGESLQQRLDRVGKLDAASAVRILDQLGKALDYAHKQGIVHRDVKPDNVLIERGTGEAKLTDFGIAKRAAGGETLTGTGLLMGTPRYMSPEQASGDREIDARSDVYALGLVGYAMLTGRPPFDGSNVQEVLRQQVMRDAPSLQKLMPELPAATVTAVERALEKDPKKRWQSAGALSSALGDDDDPGAESWSVRISRPGVYGPVVVGATFFLWNIAWAAWAWGASALAALAAFYPLLFVAGIAGERWQKKKPWRDIRKLFTEAPRWWPYWWPMKWRRADDNWARLPFAVRQTKLLQSSGVAISLLAFQSIYMGLVAAKHIPKDRAGYWVAGTFAALLGGGILMTMSLIRAQLWGRKIGLSVHESSRFVSESTSHPKFWSKPHIARLLEAAPVAVDAGEPRTILELVDAIVAAVRELPDHRDVADAARKLAAAIDALDGEIASVAREADPAEVARLEGRLTAPGNEEMRKLYASQLDVLRRLGRQREEMESRRARYAELLRTLWLQVASLRAQAAADAALATDLSGRIRELCRSVQHEVDGAREASAVLKP